MTRGMWRNIILSQTHSTPLRSAQGGNKGRSIHRWFTQYAGRIHTSTHPPIYEPPGRVGFLLSR